MASHHRRDDKKYDLTTEMSEAFTADGPSPCWRRELGGQLPLLQPVAYGVSWLLESEDGYPMTLCIHGGAGKRNKVSGALQMVNLRTLNVTSAEPITAPAPRWKHAVAVRKADKHGYIFGGAGKDMLFHDLWYYSSELAFWREVEALGDAPGPRSGHAMMFDRDGDYLYVVGGVEDDGVAKHGVWHLDMTSRLWRRVKTAVDNPSPRANFRIVPIPHHNGEDSETHVFASHGMTTCSANVVRMRLCPKRDGIVLAAKLEMKDRSGLHGPTSLLPMSEGYVVASSGRQVLELGGHLIGEHKAAAGVGGGPSNSHYIYDTMDHTVEVRPNSEWLLPTDVCEMEGTTSATLELDGNTYVLLFGGRHSRYGSISNQLIFFDVTSCVEKETLTDLPTLSEFLSPLDDDEVNESTGKNQRRRTRKAVANEADASPRFMRPTKAFKPFIEEAKDVIEKSESMSKNPNDWDAVVEKLLGKADETDDEAREDRKAFIKGVADYWTETNRMDLHSRYDHLMAELKPYGLHKAAVIDEQLLETESIFHTSLPTKAEQAHPGMWNSARKWYRKPKVTIATKAALSKPAVPPVPPDTAVEPVLPPSVPLRPNSARPSRPTSAAIRRPSEVIAAQKKEEEPSQSARVDHRTVCRPHSGTSRDRFRDCFHRRQHVLQPPSAIGSTERVEISPRVPPPSHSNKHLVTPRAIMNAVSKCTAVSDDLKTKRHESSMLRAAPRSNRSRKMKF